MLHMRKLCVGVDKPEELAEWQAERLLQYPQIWHSTRNWPRQQSELLEGGSLYWIIRGAYSVRQRIIGFEQGIPDQPDDKPPCRIILDPALVPVLPRSHRPFQGWRYLTVQDAPPDITALADADGIPPDMAEALREMGVW